MLMIFAAFAVYLCIIYTIFTLVEVAFDITPRAQLITKIGPAIWLTNGLLRALDAPEQPAPAPSPPLN